MPTRAMRRHTAPAQGMSTGAKVALAAVGIAAVGGGIFLLTRPASAAGPSNQIPSAGQSQFGMTQGGVYNTRMQSTLNQTDLQTALTALGFDLTTFTPAVSPVSAAESAASPVQGNFDLVSTWKAPSQILSASQNGFTFQDMIQLS